MIYADHNATSPLRPEAREAILAALTVGANPSSVHAAGRAARRVLERARGEVAGAIGAVAQDIAFTSGGTEANALALHGVVRALGGEVTLYVSAIEHEAVTANAGLTGAVVRSVPILPDGRVSLERLAAMMDAHRPDDGTPLLALMLANNETGVLQPVTEAAGLMRSKGGLVHCDGVQGLGKIPVDIAELKVDYLALSAHKCGGPQGVGALWVRPGAPLKPVQLGGGQERSLRSGTENLAGIAGFGAAAAASVRDLPLCTTLAGHRDAMELRLQKAGATIFGADAPRLGNTSCFGIPGFKSETQVMAMDLAGICVSAGAACSSGKVSRSGVLAAMGVPDTFAAAAIRTSYGWNSIPDDFEATAKAWLDAAARAGALGCEG